MKQIKSNNIYKIRKEGGSRVLAVGQFLPEDWRVVRVESDPVIRFGSREFVRLVLERVS